MSISELYETFLQHPIVTTDTRHCPPGSLFFALHGEKFDGNQFALQALQQGSAYAVVDDPKIAQQSKRCLLVKDTLQTLQQLATHHRLQLDTPILQITGTNGKTTTKELAAAVLGEKFNVLYTEGNLNNHIGVPLTLLRLTREHEFAVIETGANHPGEIRTLSEIVRPNCGLITNVGKAHLEGFGSFEGVIQTKTELYRYLAHCNETLTETLLSGEVRFSSDTVPCFIFLNGDNTFLSPLAAGLPTITYGSPGKGYSIEGEVTGCSPFLSLRWRKADGAWHKVNTHLIGAYNIDNVLAAVVVGHCFKVPMSAIDRALRNYAPRNNRSEFRRTDRNKLIIDAYNANLSSMHAALESFARFDAPHKLAILGDMRELGEASPAAHSEILEQSVRSNCEEIWLVGNEFARALQNSPYAQSTHIKTFADNEALKRQLTQNPIKNHLILIKGSNGMHLFELPDLL